MVDEMYEGISGTGEKQAGGHGSNREHAVIPSTHCEHCEESMKANRLQAGAPGEIRT